VREGSTARRATSLPGVGISSDLTPGSTHLGCISIGCTCPGGVLGRGVRILRGPDRRWPDLVHRRRSGARGGGGRDRRLLRDVAAIRGTRLSACGRAELGYDGTTSVVAAVWGFAEVAAQLGMVAWPAACAVRHVGGLAGEGCHSEYGPAFVMHGMRGHGESFTHSLGR
jgi:hypothetical protein